MTGDAQWGKAFPNVDLDNMAFWDGLKEHIEKRLHSDLGLRLNVELVPEDALMEWSNRGREGKPKRILDQRYDRK